MVRSNGTSAVSRRTWGGGSMVHMRTSTILGAELV
jgi:hypothetical protein